MLDLVLLDGELNFLKNYFETYFLVNEVFLLFHLQGVSLVSRSYARSWGGGNIVLFCSLDMTRGFYSNLMVIFRWPSPPLFVLSQYIYIYILLVKVTLSFSSRNTYLHTSILGVFAQESLRVPGGETHKACVGGGEDSAALC